MIVGPRCRRQYLPISSSTQTSSQCLPRAFTPTASAMVPERKTARGEEQPLNQTQALPSAVLICLKETLVQRTPNTVGATDPTLTGFKATPQDRTQVRHCSSGQEPETGQLIVLGENQTLLKDHSNKMTPNNVLLYPWTSASLSHHQRIFLLQEMGTSTEAPRWTAFRVWSVRDAVTVSPKRDVFVKVPLGLRELCGRRGRKNTSQRG